VLAIVIADGMATRRRIEEILGPSRSGSVPTGQSQHRVTPPRPWPCWSSSAWSRPIGVTMRSGRPPQRHHRRPGR
jgi:hypothetical protein